MKNFISPLILLFILSITLISCEDDNKIPQEVLEINKFVDDYMDFAYYWNTEMPNIDYNKEPDSKTYFDKLLFKDIDQWSFITDNLDELLAYFSGVRKSMGHSLRLFKISDSSDDIIAFIEYIEPNSPADLAGLGRGDMIYMVDDQVLTINNYSSLLNKESYKLSLGSFNSDFSINPITPSVNLSSVELNTNPIHISKVIEHGGKKVGYLMYKSFIDDYNDQLEDVFADFKSQGIDDLVLDLRYNGGGSVNTAILLSSMIAPADKKDEVFLRTAYNENLDKYFKEENPNDSELFIDRIQENVNNVNLDRLVVLTTYKTASASEMVMYGLSPHMEVHHIGEQTHGKYYGSITISDPDEKHSWAIQPIVMRAENIDNSIDYSIGLIPDEDRTDFLNASTFYPLGDSREDFLAQALEYLTGIVPNGVNLKSTSSPFIPINQEYKFAHPLEYDMHFRSLK